MKDISKHLMMGCVVLLLAVPTVWGSDTTTSTSDSWLKSGRKVAIETSATPQPSDEPIVHPAVVAENEPAGWTKPVPLTFSVDYTLVSDYIFRGVNFSEYDSEGTERCNQQVSVGVEADLGNFGAVGFGAWFEWYSGQQVNAFDDDAHSTLQEVDYTIYWCYDIPTTGVTFETGWIAYTFPQEKGDVYMTNEWYVSLSFDDSILFGTEGGVLNPYVAYYLDTDDVDGCWIEMGVSHDFALGEMGMGGVPVLKDITMTPSFVLGIDKNQMDEDCHLHNLQYGLDVSYDLSGALGIPEQCGSISITGFVYFSDAVNDDVINDEFWGGVTIGYEW